MNRGAGEQRQKRMRQLMMDDAEKRDVAVIGCGESDTQPPGHPAIDKAADAPFCENENQQVEREVEISQPPDDFGGTE